MRILSLIAVASVIALGASGQTTCLGLNCDSSPSDLEKAIEQQFLKYQDMQFAYEADLYGLTPDERDICMQRCRAQYHNDAKKCDIWHRPRTGFSTPEVRRNSEDYSVCMRAMKRIYDRCLTPGLEDCDREY